MSTTIVSHTENTLVLNIEIRLDGNMMQMEENIQDALNNAGALATGKALEQFDTDGSPIILGNTKLTARREKINQQYESPYGTVDVERYLYQSNLGGRTYCPLEDAARCVLNSTPRFAKIVSEKYARLGAPAVREDLVSTLRRSIAQSYIQNIADAVATIVHAKEEKWEYDIPEPPRPVKSIAVGIDGTCMLMTEDGWREAMTGTIALYDSAGERMHTTYVATTPEYGKEKFKTKMGREIERVKARYPCALVTGLGDGAKDNWSFLEPYCDRLVIDFWHVSEYVHKVADARWGDAKSHRDTKEQWLEDRLHKLKHEDGYSAQLLSEFKKIKEECKSISRRDKVEATIKYFVNHGDRMIYGEQVRRHRPIGSGVTEAACKVVVKQRLCVSGARWKDRGASVVLSLRTLVLTPGHWDSFWTKYMRFGRQQKQPKKK
jgi:hypothetical protein